MSQVTEQSVRFQTALASIKLIQASAVLDLTEDDFDFLTSNKVWIATDRSRARRCVEACVYGKSVDRKSGSAGMPRPISYAVFCLKKKNRLDSRGRVSSKPPHRAFFDRPLRARISSELSRHTHEIWHVSYDD